MKKDLIHLYQNQLNRNRNIFLLIIPAIVFIFGLLLSWKLIQNTNIQYALKGEDVKILGEGKSN